MGNKSEQNYTSTPDDLFGFVEYLHGHKSQDGIMWEHYVFKFPNGYGASVIQGKQSFGGNVGLWELAVIKFAADGKFQLVYDTPIADDVIGCCTVEEIKDLLAEIKNLEADKSQA